MRKLISFVLSVILLFNLLPPMTIAEDIPDFGFDENTDFDSLDDPAFLQYLQDSVYAKLDAEYADNEAVFRIDDVSVSYVSKEYLEETAYNTKANIFFGYTLAQIDEVFQGEKYIFTLSDTGETVVQEFYEIPSDTYNKIIRNVLIGAGVILICVTVSVLTAGAAAPAAAAGGATVAEIVTASTAAATKVHLIFAASAHTAATFAANGAVFAGATTLVTRGLETGWDMDAMAESALVSSSEGFKWGAITGAVAGGAEKAFEIHKISRGAVSPQDAEHAAQAYYGGREQVTYLAGEEVKSGTRGSVRPDVVVGNEAIEVKCYDLTHKANLYELRETLKTEISQRVVNLPEGMTQRIVLNVDGRGYTNNHVQKVVEWIQDFLDPIYPDMPVDIMGEVL